MKESEVERIARAVAAKVATIPVDELLPMPHPHTRECKKTSTAEREEFRRRRERYQQLVPGYVQRFHRPQLKTGDAVWALLTPELSTAQKKAVAGLTVEERLAFIIVLDTFVQGGQGQRHVSYNEVFDAVGRGFSDHHRRENAAKVARNMAPAAVPQIYRDLVLGNIDINKLWDLAVKEQGGGFRCNPLFSIKAVEFNGRGEYKQVFLSDANKDIRSEFVKLMDADPQYRRPRAPGLRILLADEDGQSASPPRREEVCGGVLYDVVPLGATSRKLSRLQGDVVLLFDVKAFKRDYESADQKAQSLFAKFSSEYRLDPSLSDTRHCDQETGQRAWSRREKALYYTSLALGLRGQVNTDEVDEKQVKEQLEADPGRWERHLRVYREHERKQPPEASRTSSVSAEDLIRADMATRSWRRDTRQLLAEYDRAQQHVRQYNHVYEQAQEHEAPVRICCDFNRLINRRYQALNFWPTFISAKNTPYQEKYAVPGARSEIELASFRTRWFKAPGPESGEICNLVGIDISSSQIQIIATFMGIEALEKLTMRSQDALTKPPPFKETLARWAWDMHCDEAVPWFRLKKGWETVPGYSGPDDRRLVDLVKSLCMRALYGGSLKAVLDDHKLQPETYGPGVTRTNAQDFLNELYKKFPEVPQLLEACREAAVFAYKRDPYAGISFTDPSDGLKVRWNPVARADWKHSNNGHKLTLSLAGRLKTQFEPDPPPEQGEYSIRRNRVGMSIKKHNFVLGLRGKFTPDAVLKQFLKAQPKDQRAYPLAGEAVTVLKKGHRLILTFAGQVIGRVAAQQLAAMKPAVSIAKDGRTVFLRAPKYSFPQDIITWAAAAPAEVSIPDDGQTLAIALPGQFVPGKTKREFVPHHPNERGEYPVDRAELRQRVPPCLIHMLDAYYSTLVMEKLHARGVMTFVGIHDCWLVPKRVRSGARIYEGEELSDFLEQVLDEAAGEWYRNLGTTYEELLGYLPEGSEYRKAVQDAYQKWQTRVNEGYSPQFLAKPHS